MKTIQLKGAALEAAINIKAINDAHERALDEIKARFAKEVDAFCRITREETESQLAIVEQATGVQLMDGQKSKTCQLDLRYATLGLAFVNCMDDQEAHEHVFSQALS